MSDVERQVLLSITGEKNFLKPPADGNQFLPLLKDAEWKTLNLRLMKKLDQSPKCLYYLIKIRKQ